MTTMPSHYGDAKKKPAAKKAGAKKANPFAKKAADKKPAKGGKKVPPAFLKNIKKKTAKKK